MSNAFKNASSTLSLPTGGGALRAIGEKFSADVFTGSGSLSVPIELPPGRGGLQPSLTLSYSTGRGHGPFGLGWALDVPTISRSTAHGLALYDDERDVFVLSGFEDLVPLTAEDGKVRRYRPRTEGSFSIIEHHRNAGSEDHWLVISKEGLTSWYGTPHVDMPSDGLDPATLRDPDAPRKIFEWRLTRTEDVFGNRIQYVYVRDAGSDGTRRWDAPLLSEIRYLDYGDPAAPRYLVAVAFEWEDRPDPSSAHRPGFEVRSTKRCARVVVKVDGKPLRTYHLAYRSAANGASLLASIQVEGNDAVGNGERMRPLEFGYSDFAPDRRRLLGVTTPELAPGSLLRPELDLADLSGQGLPDIVELSGGLPRFWQNLGEGRFSLPRTMKEAPGGARLGDPGVALLDADGNGRLDLMVIREPIAGVYPMRFGGRWDARSFRRYKAAPTFDVRDPEVHLVDLDGDGVTDAIRAGVESLECFFQDPVEGWTEVRRLPRRTLDSFPAISFADPRVRWADMAGDGLQDLVLVHQGRIEYWPSLGRGRWGRRVVMKNAPRLPERFNPRRVLLGDVDGDGCADLLYVEDRRVTLWLNQGGERFGAPIVIEGTPAVSDQDGIRLVDLLGTGVAGVLWVQSESGPGGHHIFFLDFTGGQKPYLLDRTDNHIGAVTEIEHAPSTRYYLADQSDPKLRWKTPLPFPVQVVAKTVTIDQVSGGRLSTEYRYHHGYWDGAEREFRGFGRVDQLDAESFADFHRGGGLTASPPERFSPPTETRRWFHRGPLGDQFGEWYEADHRDEYWTEDPNVLGRPAEVEDFLRRLPRRARRDALRALRGRVLRTELYALDATARQDRPYTVTEGAHGVSGLPGEVLPTDLRSIPEGDWRLQVFFPFTIAERTSQWERGEEPMVNYDVPGRYDAYGQVRERIAIGVPRSRARNHDRTAAGDEAPFLATLTRTDCADGKDAYLKNRVAQVRIYEIENAGEISVAALIARAHALGASLDLGSERTPAGLKLLSEMRNYYDGAAFTGLDLGKVGKYGALVRTEVLVMDADQLAAAYGTDVPPFLTGGAKPADWPNEYWDAVKDGAGYRRDGPRYWAASARTKFDFHAPGPDAPRGLALETKDALGRVTATAYDTKYRFFPVVLTNPAGLVTRTGHDLHFLRPSTITDPNGNEISETYTPLGLVAQRFVRGKTASEGDQKTPSERYTYDFERLPISARRTQRIYHDGDDDPIILAHKDDIAESVTYSDGFGREVQTRTRAEARVYGQLPLGRAVLEADVNQDATTPLAPHDDHDRAVVSGFKRYDNKGRIVEAAEPYFDGGLSYPKTGPGPQRAVVRTFYDVRGQLVRTQNPDGSETRLVRGTPRIRGTEPVLSDPDGFEPSAWEVWTYDTNDSAARDHSGSSEDLAAGRAGKTAFSAHADTPSSTVLDALLRTVATTERLATKSDPSTWLTFTAVYDLLGNQIELRDPKGNVVSSTIYDSIRRPLKSSLQDASDRWTLMDAADAEISTRNTRGALGLALFDHAGRATKTWARDHAGDSVTLRQVTRYGDEDIPDDAVRAERRGKNLLGRPMVLWDEAGRVDIEAYDFKGNMTKRARRVISDKALLDVFKGFPKGASWKVAPYRVDWAKTGADADLGTTAYTTEAAVDALGRLKWTTYPVSSGSPPKLVPTYNEAGALQRIDLDNRTIVEHIAYDAKGQRVLVVANCGKSGGPITKRILVRYAHDAASFRLVRMRSEACKVDADGIITPLGDPYQDTGYLYDLVGNLWKVLERAKGSGVASKPDELDRLFTYDALYRLLSATGRETQILAPLPAAAELLWSDRPYSGDPTKAQPYKETYRYDEVGFMRDLKRASTTGMGTVVHTRTFDSTTGSNRLASVTYADPGGGMGPFTVSYAYDEGGNVVFEGAARHFEWDALDRLRVFRVQTSDTSEPSVYAQYLYDGAGQRVKKLVRKQGGVGYDVTVYIDGILEHRIVVGGTTKEGQVLHVMDGTRRLARVRVGETFDGKPAGLLGLEDHLGSANIELDLDTGAFVDREEFRPYGETSFGSYHRKRSRFTGKERDEESGLAYHGARYYAPSLGRWLSPDPMGTVDGTNRYAYARTNPIRFFDPRGEEAVTPAGQERDGERRGSRPPSAVSPYTRIHGTFDGKEFAVFGDLQGGRSVELLRIEAQSGRPYSVSPADAARFGGSTRDSYINNRRYVGVEDNGPIPEGTYRFNTSTFVNFGWKERWSLLFSDRTDPFGRTVHHGDWGAGRVELTPIGRLQPTEFGPDPRAPSRRSGGFYLHGGVLTGSSGCIDIGNNGIEKLNKALTGYAGTVAIEVRYTHPAPDVGRITRALGRYTYPTQKEAGFWNRLKSAVGYGTEH